MTPSATAPRKSSRLQLRNPTPIKTTQRRSLRLQQKCDKADSETRARKPLYNVGRVPTVVENATQKSTLQPDSCDRKQTPGNELVPKEQPRKRKRKESLGGRSETGLIQQSPLEEDLPRKKPREEHRQIGDPVDYWALFGQWPPWYADMKDNQSGGSRKRIRSGSYTSSYRNGEVPEAHTGASVEQLRTHGISLERGPAMQYISEEDRKMCARMLQKPHKFTPSVDFPLSELTFVLDRLSSRNENRVVRDISPLLVPSPESLTLSGYIKSQAILEDVGAEWKGVSTMGGPVPKPDLTIGLDRSAFGDDEFKKLQNYKSWNHTVLFTHWIYFPFLICEVKCSDVSISRAARQSGHAGSIAANAIFELFLSNGFEKAKSLSGKILAFSVAHDHESARVFGHFPYIEKADTRPIFYRYTIHEVLFGQKPVEQMKSVRDFVLEIYSSWYPSHLARIKDALKEMSLPSTKPPPSRASSSKPSEEQVRDSEAMPPPTASASQMLLDQVNQLTSQLQDVNAQLQTVNTQLQTQRDEFERTRDAEREQVEKTRNAEREQAEKTRNAEREQAEKTRNAEREQAEKTRNAEREQAEKTRKAEREQAEQRYNIEREKAEQRYNVEREKAEQRYKDQQKLLEQLIANIAGKPI